MGEIIRVNIKRKDKHMTNCTPFNFQIAFKKSCRIVNHLIGFVSGGKILQKKTKMLIQIWFQPIESEYQDLSKYLLKRLKIPNFLCNLLTSVTSLTGSAYLA